MSRLHSRHDPAADSGYENSKSEPAMQVVKVGHLLQRSLARPIFAPLSTSPVGSVSVHPLRAFLASSSAARRGACRCDIKTFTYLRDADLVVVLFLPGFDLAHSPPQAGIATDTDWLRELSISEHPAQGALGNDEMILENATRAVRVRAVEDGLPLEVRAHDIRSGPA